MSSAAFRCLVMPPRAFGFPELDLEDPQRKTRIAVLVLDCVV